MKQFLFAAIASVGVFGFVATDAAKAQAFAPSGSPIISPYLNLNRAGAPPAINYYNLVRPQFQYGAAINTLEQQVQASRVAATAAETQAVPTTGHPVSFLNYRRYFLNTGASSPFQNVQASGRALGAGSLPVGSGVGTPGTRSAYGGYGAIGAYGGGGIGGIGNIGYRP
jgi:hypothetical protein